MKNILGIGIALVLTIALYGIVLLLSKIGIDPVLFLLCFLVVVTVPASE